MICFVQFRAKFRHQACSLAAFHNKLYPVPYIEFKSQTRFKCNTYKTILYSNLFYQKLISLSMAFSANLYHFHFITVHKVLYYWVL